MLVSDNNLFKHLSQRLNIRNIVFEPTNFTRDTDTCIDLVLTNGTKLGMPL